MDRFGGICGQVQWAYQADEAIESIYYVYQHEKEKFLKSVNFFYIARIALADFYTLELTKLLNKSEEINIFSILKECPSHPDLFRSEFEYRGKTVCSFDVDGYCQDFLHKLNDYQNLGKNLRKRRNKTLAHNDTAYFHFNAAAIDQFPLDNEQLKEAVATMYNGLDVLRASAIFEVHPQIPTDTDDLKRLFGLETASDAILKGWATN